LIFDVESGCRSALPRDVNMIAGATGGHEEVAAARNASASRSVGHAAGIHAGFVDIINLLLGPPETNSPTELPDQQPLPDPNRSTAPTVRSPHDIAEALIRAMSIRRHVSSNAFSDSTNGKPVARKQGDPICNPLAGTASQAALPLLQPSTVADTPSRPVQQPLVAGLATSDAVKAGTPAALAFALKLTPKSSACEDSSGSSQTGDQSVANPSPREPNTISGAQRVAEIAPVSPVPSADSQASDLLVAKSRSFQDHIGSDLSGNQARQAVGFAIVNPAPSITQRSPVSVVGVTSRSAADALRSAVPETRPPTVQNSPALEIAMRIARPEAAVDVHVTERAGQVHVAVRTPDAGLQTSLRQDLGTLVNSLDRAGFHAETMSSHSPISAPSAPSHMNGEGAQQQESDPGSGRHSGGQFQGRQQHRHGRNIQDWLEAMENIE
jgi:hypothetical protein